MKRLICLLVFISSAACTQGGGSPVPSDSQRPQYLGDLDQKAQELYGKDSENYFYKCDFKTRDKALEICRAVEGNKAKIKELAAERNKNRGLKEILINNFPFLENPNASNSKDEWTTDTDSWNEVYETFLKIKDKPEDSRWVYVNNSARSLIMEDEGRTWDWDHPAQKRNFESIIDSAAIVSQRCFEDANCILPTFTAEELAWVEMSEHLQWSMERLKDPAYLVEKKRKQVKNINSVIQAAAKRFKFRINDTISKKDGNILLVPLNLAVFGSDAGRVSSYLQDTWSTQGLKIEIINSQDPKAFRVEVKIEPGTRAYVSTGSRLMKLFAPERMSTVAHEFGHVLGIRDQYYTSFDTENCVYTYEGNDANLMSTSSTGKVLPEHVQQLKKEYGL